MSTELLDPPVDMREPFIRLSKDLKQSSHKLSRRDARWLVDMYYTIQDERIRSASQRRTSEETGEPCQLIEWVFESMRRFENAIKAALGEFAATYQVGQWMQSQYGIGPVLSAACLCHFDIRKAATVGHFWRFAGLDPSLKWLGKSAGKELLESLGVKKELLDDQVTAIQAASGQHPQAIRRAWTEGFSINPGTKVSKGRTGVANLLAVRPWNAKLKAIVAFRMGECFVKFSVRDECFYGKLYAAHKVGLAKQNARGDFADTAKAALAENRIGEGTEAYKHLSEGRLPPAQIHARARRWAVKLFLSHLHHVAYRDYHDADPPAPWIFEHPNGEDHRHLVVPPNWPGEFDGKRLREMRD